MQIHWQYLHANLHQESNEEVDSQVEMRSRITLPFHSAFAVRLRSDCANAHMNLSLMIDCGTWLYLRLRAANSRSKSAWNYECQNILFVLLNVQFQWIYTRTSTGISSLILIRTVVLLVDLEFSIIGLNCVRSCVAISVLTSVLAETTLILMDFYQQKTLIVLGGLINRGHHYLRNRRVIGKQR